MLQAKSLHRAGKLGPAEQLYRQVLHHSPSHAEAWYLLAGTCHAQGRLAEALAHYQQAICLNPNAGDCHRNLAVALHQMGRRPEAATSLREALRLNPHDVEAYFWLGNFCIERGRYDDAVDALQTAIRLRPDYFKTHSELGVALRREGRHAEAIAEFQEAIRLHPLDTVARSRLGSIFVEEGKVAAAVAIFHEALRIRPDYAMAFHSLGELHRQGLYFFSDAELAHMKQSLQEQRLPVPQLSLLCFALGYVRERAADYDGAFAYFRQGNELRQRYFEERGLRLGGRERLAWAAAAAALFTPAYFRGVASWGVDSELPIFVVGMMRSGTTLVEQILASHPQVHGAGELTDIQRISEDLPEAIRAGVGYPDCLAHGDAGVLQPFGERYLNRLRARSAGLRVVDKMPDNYFHLGLIATLFPRARVIFCRRDPLDTCVSCFTQSFNDARWAWDLPDLALYCQAYERMVRHWRAVLPLRSFEVHYEQLVQNQESITRQLIEFCGLKWDERCLAFHESRRPVQTASRLQVRQPMHARSIGKWKRYEKHLAPLLAALEETNLRPLNCQAPRV